MPEPIKVADRTPDMIQVVCPECLEGHLRLHVRYRTTLGGEVVEAATFIRCTRQKKCGWWQPLTPKKRIAELENPA